MLLQIEDHPLVSFLPLDLTSTESLETVISHIDFCIQYGEDEEPKEVWYPLFECTPGFTDKKTMKPRDLDEGDFKDMD